MKIALLIATALLFGAPAAIAQTQPVIHKDIEAKASTTKKPDGTSTTTNESKVVTDTPVAAAAAKPAAAKPAPKAQPAPAKPATSPKRGRRNNTVIHHWEPFDIGNQSPKELAAKIRASLAIDSTGNLVIDTKNCKPNGYSCGTPQQYLEGLQKSDDRANIKTFGDLLKVLDRLQMTSPPKGEYWMACLQKQPDGKVIVIWDCMSREFGKLPDGADESAWVDPETGKVVLAQHCTNPVGAKVEDCDEQHIWLYAGDELHGTVAGPDAIPDDACRPAIRMAGEKEWHSAKLDKCPRVNCDYSEDLAEARRRYPETEWKLQDFRISFDAPVTGEYVVRVSRFFEHSKDLFWYCVVFPDGTQTNAIAFTKDSYQSFGWAYADYEGEKALSAKARAAKGWKGVVHPWHRADERAFNGPRPPVGAAPK